MLEPRAWARRYPGKQTWVVPMFGWSLTFFFLALIAAYLGFVGLAGVAAVFVKMLLLVFLVLLAATGLIGLVRGEPPT